MQGIAPGVEPGSQFFIADAGLRLDREVNRIQFTYIVERAEGEEMILRIGNIIETMAGTQGFQPVVFLNQRPDIIDRPGMQQGCSAIAKVAGPVVQDRRGAKIGEGRWRLHKRASYRFLKTAAWRNFEVYPGGAAGIDLWHYIFIS